jgi:hypothetical protein
MTPILSVSFTGETKPLCQLLCRFLSRSLRRRLLCRSVALSFACRFLSRDDIALSVAPSVASSPLLANTSCFIVWFHGREEPALLVALSLPLSVASSHSQAKRRKKPLCHLVCRSACHLHWREEDAQSVCIRLMR